MYDVCVIGAGASGLCCAITAARRGLNVYVIEKNKKAGKKLYATGNGKCNLTNRYFSFAHNYHSTSSQYELFLKTLLGSKPDEELFHFFESIGLKVYQTTEGYVYPMSNQASAVVWSMLDEAQQLGVKFDFRTQVTNIHKNTDSFTIHTTNGQITASEVVLACGGRSYPSLGGSDYGYQLAKSVGHTITNVMPALCGVKVKEDISSLSGVRARANVNITLHEEVIAYEDGEVQFTNYGLSGIVIFNMTSIIGKNLSLSNDIQVVINLLPGITPDEIKNLYDISKNRSIHGTINSLLNDKLACYILHKIGINEKTKTSDVSFSKFKEIIHYAKHFTCSVDALCDYETAQVCSGGVCIDEIDAVSCESKICPGTYVVGEILDIDGACGGYNLTFAFISGIRAGEHIC
ncbi:MAG: aminoacetone oxidase family FAD-binding enzyme [Lachnospiraceae bacterium]|nr:aminoacetone oxidase family FAD-binding enzyme [Lachnospiraceae bacterium]